MVRKKKSPSTLRRNLRRQEEYLKKKANSPSETHLDADIEKSGENPAENSEVIEEADDHKEDTSEQSLSFKCKKCDYENKTEKRFKAAHSKKA